MIGMEAGQAASRLFDALEKLGTSTGSGLQSFGPGAQPSDELVKAFEEMLNAVKASGMEGVQSPEAVDTQALGANAVTETTEPGPAERVPGMEFQVDSIGKPSAAEQVDKSGRSHQVAATDTSLDITDAIPGVDTPGSMEFKVENTSASHAVQEPQANTASQSPEALIKELGQLMGTMAQNGGLTQMELFRVQYLVGILKVQSSGGMKASQSVSQGMESLLKQKG